MSTSAGSRAAKHGHADTHRDGSSPFSCEGGSVDVWVADLRRAESVVERLGKLLDAQERQRAAAYLRDEHGRRFTAARAILRLLLARYLNCDAEGLQFIVAPQGKPFLSGGPGSQRPRLPYFNVSHSGDQAVYAICGHGEVGVDVEQVRPIDRLDGLVEQVCSESERALFTALPLDARLPWFLRVWTRKEAVAKAVGDGLRLPFRQFSVCSSTISPRYAVRLPDRLPGRLPDRPSDLPLEWTVYDLPPVSDHQAAVALPGHEDRAATIRVARLHVDGSLGLHPEPMSL